MNRRSSRDRGRLKAAESAALELFRKLNTPRGARPSTLKPEPAHLRAMSICMLLYFGTTAEEAIRISGYEDAGRLVARMRHTKLLHGDRLDVTEWDRSAGLLVFILDVMAVAGTDGAQSSTDLEAGVFCPKCEQRMNRAGKSSTGAQRWRCTACGSSTCFPASTPEGRLRVPVRERREIIRLGRKGYPVAEIARRTEVSEPTVRKVLSLWREGRDLTAYCGDLHVSPETPGLSGAYQEMSRSAQRLGEPRKRRMYRKVETTP
jgi:transposase-like protein